jgi:uncharacterized membrane protein
MPLLGRLHPAIVHFPVAGLPLALLGFLTWVVSSRAAFEKADALPLLLATAAAVAAVISGNNAFDSLSFSESMRTVAERHQTLSTAIMIVCLALTLVRLLRWNRLGGLWRWIYGLGLLAAVVMVSITGYLGGSLVFGPDHLGLF